MIIQRKIHRYGCKPDIKDHRDFLFHESDHYKVMALPPSVSLRDKLPACWDQGDEGSCTGHGNGGAVAFIHPGFMPSRQEIYYNGRIAEGTTGQDDGAQIRDVVAALAQYGVADESLWPYEDSNMTVKPTPDVYSASLAKKISSYYRITDINDYKNCLAQGFPVVFGFTVYENMESQQVATSGILGMPTRKMQIVGGHCVLGIGYNDTKGMIEVRNSWGTGWGDQGNFWMDYKYFQKLISDMWTVRA